MWKIQYRQKVTKFINLLDPKYKKISIDKINGLRTHPYPKKKEHFIQSKGNSILCELSLGGKSKIRYYYYIFEDKILLQDVTYEKNSILIFDYSNTKGGSKNKGTSQQQRKINRLKKNISKKISASNKKTM